MLARAVSEGLHNGVVEPLVVVQAASFDTYAAAKYTQRTFFDYGWVAKAFGQFWQTIEPSLPPVPGEIFTELHPTVKMEDLRQSYIISRHMGRYYSFPPQDEEWGSAAQKAQAYSWMATKGLWGHGTAIRVFHDIRDVCGSDFALGSVEQLTQAALALGHIYYVRIEALSVTIRGVVFQDASEMVMSRLKLILSRLLTLFPTDQLVEYHDAHLWLLYLGAFYEKRASISAEEHDRSWFQQNLIQMARTLRRTKWNDLVPILDRFLHRNWLEPRGLGWYEDLVAGFSVSAQ
jgi:hypothetical protein